MGMTAALHVCLAGPIAGDDVRHLLAPGAQPPAGYAGAPLTAILIGELLARGHRVTGLTTDPRLPLSGGPVRLQGPGGFEFVVVPQRPRAWRFSGLTPGRALDLFALERRLLAQEMRRAAPDLVHAHWSYEFALAAIDTGLPHVITCHDSPAVVWRYTRSPYRLLRWAMARQVFRRGRCFTTVSDYMARELAPALAAPAQVIPNPVAQRAFDLGRELMAGTSRRVAMICNGWDRRKNPEPALRAFALFRRTEATAELHLYGSGFGPGEAAQRWAQAEGVADGLHFHGRTPHAEMLQALSGMDALLHPALEESFGVVIAEAMALGLPVVGGRESGAVPWVMGATTQAGDACEAGVLIDVSRPECMAQALAQVFDASYQARSRAARTRAISAYSAPNIARAYEGVYHGALCGRGSASNDVVALGVAP